MESGTDQINAALQQQYHDVSLEEILRFSRQTHAELWDLLESWSDEDFFRPYRHFDPASDREDPIIGLLPVDTYEHYSEHTTWIVAIVGHDENEG